MKTEEIYNEIKREINKRLLDENPEKIEKMKFGIEKLPLEIMRSKDFYKIQVWFDLNPKTMKNIFKKICDNFNWEYSNIEGGQYLYLKDKF